jgi:hypothetical protein
MFHWFVPKMRQALTFSATIENDHSPHENVGCHFNFGFADDVGGGRHGPDSNQRSAADGATRELNSLWGDEIMLSVDQFLRLISLPAVVAAFLIASQVSGAGIFQSTPTHLASE